MSAGDEHHRPGDVPHGVLGALCGPWPFYPWVLGGIGFGALVVRGSGRAAALSSDLAGTLDVLAPNLVIAVFGAGMTVGLLTLVPYAAERLVPAHGAPLTRRRYLVLVVVAGVASALLITAATRVVGPDSPDDTHAPLIVSLGFSVPGSVLTLLLFNGVAASIAARLQVQERLLAQRLDEVQRQRRAVLASDERVRREIAVALHDDVQSRLLRTAILLGTLRGRVGGGAEQALEEAIADIEDMRERGVRALGRRLAPDLRTTGLPTALREGAEVFDGVVEVRFAFSEAAVALSGHDEPAALAVYRIAEQAMQNALKHGHATEALVALDVSEDGRLRLVVEANGEPPPARPIPGEGMRIMDAWLAETGGWWTLDALPAGGSRLAATVGTRGPISPR